MITKFNLYENNIEEEYAKINLFLDDCVGKILIEEKIKTWSESDNTYFVLTIIDKKPKLDFNIEVSVIDINFQSYLYDNEKNEMCTNGLNNTHYQYTNFKNLNIFTIDEFYDFNKQLVVDIYYSTLKELKFHDIEAVKTLQLFLKQNDELRQLVNLNNFGI